MQTTPTNKTTRRIPVNALGRAAATAAAVAALAVPAAAAASQGTPGQLGNEKLSQQEEAYLEVRREFVDEFSEKDAGRNLVRWGQQEKDGDVRPAKPAELEDSVEYMRAQLNPPETVSAPAGGSAAATSYDSSGAPTSVIECESGGDYGAVNPAGYYGAYQFDQGTWDAYAPEGYAGTNPAEAPPEVQDAAAAAVPYDAWPNC